MTFGRPVRRIARPILRLADRCLQPAGFTIERIDVRVPPARFSTNYILRNDLHCGHVILIGTRTNGLSGGKTDEHWYFPKFRESPTQIPSQTNCLPSPLHLIQHIPFRQQAIRCAAIRSFGLV
jgi:hypothetical protein